MAWILDLSTTPPDIYTDNTVQGNVHNCLESPYPKTMWYMTENPNDINTAATKDYYSPCLEMPFPSPLWYITTDPNDVRNASYRETDVLGAFAHCKFLKTIVLPDSLTSIGPDAFSDSGLEKVTIPNSQCTYYATSFPPSCVVTGGHLIE